MKNLKPTNVQVCALNNIDDFYVIQTKDLKWLKIISVEINQDELLKAQKDLAAFVDFPKLNQVVLSRTSDNSPYYRAKILDFKTIDNILNVHVIYIDYGIEKNISVFNIVPCPQKFQDIMPLAFNCSMFDCFSMKEETLDLFKTLVTSKTLQMEVMNVDVKKKVLQVDLVMMVEDDVQYTSIRDCLIFAGNAVFETNPYAAIPNCNNLSFSTLPAPQKGTQYQVFVSHVPYTCPGDHVSLCVQVVSPASLALPMLSYHMSSVYSTRYSELSYSMTGEMSPGVVCAVSDQDGAWYRGIITDVLSERKVMVRYELLLVNFHVNKNDINVFNFLIALNSRFVDFGNTELVSVHKIRRLKKEFLNLPALLQPVYLDSSITSVEECEMVTRELSDTILYQELNMTVNRITDQVKSYVKLETITGQVDIDQFIGLLKQDLVDN